MGGLLASVFSGLMNGLITPLFGYLGKRDDDNLAAYKSGTEADRANLQATLAYQAQIQQIKIQSNQPIGHKIAYDIVAWTASIHVAAINLDSTFLFNWHVAKLPSPYDGFEQLVVSSLFVSTFAAPIVNSVSQWFRKA